MPGGKGHAGEELSTGGGQPRRGQGHGLGSPPPAPQCCHKWELLVRLFPDFENSTYHLLDAKSRVSIVNPLGNMERDQKEVDRGKKVLIITGYRPQKVHHVAGRGLSLPRRSQIGVGVAGGWWQGCVVLGAARGGAERSRGFTAEGGRPRST